MSRTSKTAAETAGGVTMSILDHLDELRTRLIRSCLAIAAGMLVAFAFRDQLAGFVLTPILQVMPPDGQLITTRLGEGFSFYLNIAFVGGLILSSPFVMYQVWLFIAPALYADERKLALSFAVLASVGTVAGALFSHYVLFPAMVSFFGLFRSPHLRFMPGIENTFDQYLRIVLSMVLVFQLPTLVFFLAKLRVVTARLLWRHVKYALLLSVIAGALLTPSPDPWNQMVFAAPMFLLYLISIGIAWAVGPRTEPEGAPKPPTLRVVVMLALIHRGWLRFITDRRIRHLGYTA